MDTPIYRSRVGAQAVRRRHLELLDRWPVEHQRLTVPTRAGDTSVVVSGPEGAPPVLAVQGSGANTAMWLPWIGIWAQHLRVYAVDVIGEPGLSAPVRPPLASEAYAEWLDDVLDALGLPAVSMVGVSLGGWLVLDHAIRRPERVSRLALVNPSGIGRRRIGLLVKAVLLAPFGDLGRRVTLRGALGPGDHGTRRAAPGTDDLDALLADFALLIFKHYRPRMEAVPLFDDASLRGVACPVFAVLGGRDALLDAHHTRRRLEANTPHATVRLLPDAVHHLPGQARPVLEFLLAQPVVRSGSALIRPDLPPPPSGG